MLCQTWGPRPRARLVAQLSLLRLAAEQDFTQVARYRARTFWLSGSHGPYNWPRHVVLS
jgi:hypothetical protein